MILLDSIYLWGRGLFGLKLKLPVHALFIWKTREQIVVDDDDESVSLHRKLQLTSCWWLTACIVLDYESICEVINSKHAAVDESLRSLTLPRCHQTLPRCHPFKVPEVPVYKSSVGGKLLRSIFFMLECIGVTVYINVWPYCASLKRCIRYANLYYYRRVWNCLWATEVSTCGDELLWYQKFIKSIWLLRSDETDGAC